MAHRSRAVFVAPETSLERVAPGVPALLHFLFKNLAILLSNGFAGTRGAPAMGSVRWPTGIVGGWPIFEEAAVAIKVFHGT